MNVPPSLIAPLRVLFKLKRNTKKNTGKQSNLAPVLAEIYELRQRYEDCVVLAKSEQLKSSFLAMLKMNEMVE